jgi:hypothetical protein
MNRHARFPLLSALALAALLGCEDDPTGPAEARNFSVTMTGAKEVPSRTPAGTGTATFTLDAAETTLTYSISVQNMTTAISAAHIHLGNASVAGSIIVALTTPVNNSTVTGTINSTTVLGLGLSWESLLDLIRNGDTYVNVHTTMWPGGETRGQIDSVS